MDNNQNKFKNLGGNFKMGFKIKADKKNGGSHKNVLDSVANTAP